MRVLVACEESQRVTLAFRKYGCLAFSCDIKDCSGLYPQYHIKADARDVVLNNSWDLIIAHPPCTYLAKSGSCNMYKNGIIDSQRYEKLLEAREFFMFFYNLDIPYCIENPVPFHLANLPKFSQTIQPYDFGADFSKLTCLWLNKLPYLIPTCIVPNRRSFGQSWTSVHRAPILRSKTFPEVAEAMARQWGMG